VSRQLLEYHPVVGYRFIPHLKARVPHESGGYLVRVNGAGFRSNREFVPGRTPGTRRVLLFGDSFSAGDGVSNEKRWGDLLETLVPGLEVYNFALPGTGTDQQYLAWRELAHGIEHDVLLLAVLVENIRRVVARFRVYLDDQGREVCYEKPFFERVDGTLELHNVPPRKAPIPSAELAAEQARFVDRGGRFPALRRIVGALGLREVAQSLTGYQPLPDYDSPESPAWLLLRSILEQWIRGQAKPVVLMVLPLHQYVEQTADPAAYQARFRELAEATGATLHDPLPDLWRYPAAERRRFRFERDVHPTPEGHAALAASLAPVLERVLAGAEP
jgi:lysophospholipase L1-like esterase